MGIYEAYSKLKRIKQIVEILTRHQLGFLIDLLGLTRFTPVSAKSRKPGGDKIEATHNIWARARMVLEDLGGTFIKMGQILSTRGDILPRELVEELEKLQDRVPPFGFDEVKRTVERELNIHIEDEFEDLESQPLASASLGQVHKAKLKSGEEVVLKVLRPDMKTSVAIDCEILLDTARFLEKRKLLKGKYNFVSIAREIKEFLEEETDYTHEVQNAERFRKNFSSDSSVYVPRVHWGYTSGKVLCLERVEGIKIVNLEGIKSRGFDVKEIAKSGITAYLKQILVHGFFHADPHPGNIFVTPEGKIAFVDFGLVGELDRELRNKLGDLFIAISRHNIDGVIDALLSMGSIQTGIDRLRLKKDFSYIYEKYSALPLKQLNLREFAREILEIIFRHQIRIPPDLTLMIKTLVVLEGLGKQLDPDFNILEVAEPFTRDIVRERVMSRWWFSDSLKSIQDKWGHFGDLMQQATSTLGAIEKGELKVTHEHFGLHKMVNRLCFAIIIAAVFIGSSWIFSSPSDFSILGLLGFFISGIMGLWLLYSIIRSGRL